LVISKAISPNTLEQVNSEILVEAVTRYTNVAARENNVTAVYFLSLANCNLNKMEEALDLLNEAVRTNPDNEFLSEQLNILIAHVATRLNKYETVSTKGTRDFIKGTFAEDAFKKKILVVDDSPTTRKVVVLTLLQKGYKIFEAQDGLEALSKIDSERPDLILLDVVLPKMDGYKILSIVKDNKELKQIPVIMLTSKDGLINKVKGKLAGSAAYLTKPFDPKELIETVRKFI
jgi:twitching motility two-component system response regulator PilG